MGIWLQSFHCGGLPLYAPTAAPTQIMNTAEGGGVNLTSPPLWATPTAIPTEASTVTPTRTLATTQQHSEGCHGTGAWTGQVAMDQWCVTNCAAGRVFDSTLQFLQLMYFVPSFWKNLKKKPSDLEKFRCQNVESKILDL